MSNPKHTHVLRWTEWDDSVHEITFPSAEAAAKVWRQLSKASGMAVVSFLIEPIDGGQRVSG